MPEITMLCLQDPATNTDKVYNVGTFPQGDGTFVVRADWGRRNGHLQSQLKYRGSDRAEARRVHERLVRTKVQRGYRQVTAATHPSLNPPEAPAAAVRMREASSRRTPSATLATEAPPLARPAAIDRARMEDLATDPRWCAQPLAGGDRAIIRIRRRGDGAVVDAIGETRTPIRLAPAVVEALRAIRDYALLDARISDSEVWVSDLLGYRPRGTTRGSDEEAARWLRTPYWRRLEQLETLLSPVAAGGAVRIVATAWSLKEKREFARGRRHGPALLLREIEAGYEGGRPRQLFEYRLSA